jgi:protoporphyrinogen oxidase
LSKRNIVVVGAGIGGLSAAHWLGKRGHEVEVLEAADRPGGRMQLLERNGDLADVGAQFFHSSYQCALQLMDELGLAPNRRTISAGTQFARPDGSKFVLRHDWDFPRLLGAGGSASLMNFALRYLALGKRFPMSQIVRSIPEYDGRSIADIVRGSDPRHLDYVVRPVCLGETVAYPEHTSLYHYIHQLRLTLYTRFVALTRGVSSLTDALARRVSVRYEAPVRRVIWEGTRASGVELEDGTACRADHVIVATTPDAAARILPDEMDEQRGFLASFPQTPIPLPIFFLDRPLSEEVCFYFGNPSDDRSFNMAVDQTARVPEMVPSGKAIVSAWPAYPKTVALIGQPDDRMIGTALEDMEKLIPGFSGWVDDAAVVRHGWGNAIYPPGQYQKVIDFREKAEALAGISFVGSPYGGVHMEAAILTAKRAVTRVEEGR